ncbi:MAG: Two-component system response regulator, partial [Actinomyces urogenitalis DORA_12]
LVYAGRVSSVDALLAAGGALPRLALMSLALCDGSDPVSNVRRLREAGVRVLAYFAGADRYQVRRAYEVAQVGVVRSWDEGPVMLEELRQALDDASGPLQRWTDVLGIDAATVVSDRLTAVEREVLMVYAAVATADYVARRLGLATNTVNKYVAKARRRYAEAGKTADSRADLVRLAQEDGLLPLALAARDEPGTSWP